MDSQSTTIEGLLELLGVVRKEVPSFLPATRWLLAASQLIAGSLEEHPPLLDLRHLYQLIRRKAPHLAPLLDRIATEEPFEALRAEIYLDLLCVTTWKHPTEVIANPPLRELLRTCRLRLTVVIGDQKRRLKEVEADLARAVSLSETARRRRNRTQEEKGSIGWRG